MMMVGKNVQAVKLEANKKGIKEKLKKLVDVHIPGSRSQEKEGIQRLLHWVFLNVAKILQTDNIYNGGISSQKEERNSPHKLSLGREVEVFGRKKSNYKIFDFTIIKNDFHFMAHLPDTYPIPVEVRNVFRADQHHQTISNDGLQQCVEDGGFLF